MTDAKRRAQERLASMIEEACDVVEKDIKGQLTYARGSTRVLSSRYVIDAVLERLPEAPAAGTGGASMSADELAAKREQLRLARLAERKQA